MALSLHEHERRIDDLNDKVSETRRTVVGLDKGLAVVLSRLKTIERLVFLAVTGILALVGSDLYHKLMGS
jgi:uncharacterized coiled-coil protein SlyX